MIDESIKKHLQADARKGFELVYEHYYRPLCMFALRYFDDEAEAEDAVQRTLVKLWDKNEEFQQVSAIKTYLYQSVKNTCLNILRDDTFKKNTQSEVDIELLELACNVPEPENEHFDLVLEAIDQLPPQCKKVLELNRMQGFTYKEIAEQLNISHRTVDTHLTTAMRILREKLRPTLVCATLFLVVLFLGI